jgi:urate oxidase
VEIAERVWERLETGGRPHGTAFRRPGGETRLAVATVDRAGGDAIEAGLDDLVILKTARSAFAGFARDRFTTLRDTDDRLLATALRAVWLYAAADAAFASLRAGIRQTLLDTFAEHDSRSVQHTLYAMGEAVLERHGEVREIRLTMPNKHHVPVDLAPFGLPNENAVFVATDEPYGLIEATVERSEK